MGKKILITGATGMVGSLALQQCLQSDEIDSVVSLLRRPSGVAHIKLQEIVIDNFLLLEQDADYFQGIDIVLYCQGVYTGAVDRELFRQITVDYPESLANALIKNNPALRFCLLSGAGADRKEKSRMMFAKDKGAIENRISAIGFGSFHSFRPGYIYPTVPREEPNFTYRLTRRLYPLTRLLGKNASIKSTELATAMVNVGLRGHDREVLENRDILQQVN